MRRYRRPRTHLFEADRCEPTDREHCGKCRQFRPGNGAFEAPAELLRNLVGADDDVTHTRSTILGSTTVREEPPGDQEKRRTTDTPVLQARAAGFETSVQYEIAGRFDEDRHRIVGCDSRQNAFAGISIGTRVISSRKLIPMVMIWMTSRRSALTRESMKPRPEGQRDETGTRTRGARITVPAGSIPEPDEHSHQHRDSDERLDRDIPE